MMRKRLIAALLLYGFAIGAPLFWSGGEWDALGTVANLVAASVGLLLLHLKWKRGEPKVISRKEIQDTFE